MLLCASAQTLSTSPIAKPNCKSLCGNITIPFPFGTTLDCSIDPKFLVTCNHTSFHPPRLFAENTDIQITDISLDGQIKWMHYIASNCYYKNDTSNKTISTLTTGMYFTVNNTANKVTVVGCDTYAHVFGTRARRNYTIMEYNTGCDALCYSLQDLEDMYGSCMGSGCCQTSIPRYVSELKITLGSYKNYSEVSDFNNCGFAFLAEEGAFNFSRESFSSLKNTEELPLVLDWAIGNKSCNEAMVDSSSYACRSLNSSCYDPTNGDGYRCRCNKGYEGNPYLSDGCRDIDECRNGTHNCSRIDYCKNRPGDYTCSCPRGHSGNGRGENGCIKIKNPIAKIAYIFVGVLLVVTLFVVARWLYLEFKRRWFELEKEILFRKNGGALLQEKLKNGEGSTEVLRIFTLLELQMATDKFNNSMIIGQGGFGTVYKGLLVDQSTIAIKKSKRVDPDQVDQFINEVIILSQINHRNIVRLLGCCLETEIPLLVYEFVSNGTLSSHIYNPEKAHLLWLDKRLKIAVETADVLSYLHFTAVTQIIHRDVKPDNILLDDTYTAKVSDFGASRLVPVDHTMISSMVQGTFGYLDPEYLQTNQLTEKSDVYSFGVVLLQLLTGRKAVSFEKPEEEQILVNYVLYMLRQERLFEILDTNIDVNDGRNREQIIEAVEIALGCLHMRGDQRPSMREVAMELERLRMGEKHPWGKHTIENIGSMGEDENEIMSSSSNEGR